MKRISALILDDERSAAQSLMGMLKECCPAINITQVATSIEEGLTLANQYQPDLVFLDIEMPPQGTGFDFLKQTQHLKFNVIFTTAHAQYAIQAINQTQPLAYLVKPIQTTELIQAVQVATKQVAAPQSISQQNHRGIILTDMRKGNIVVRYTDLVYCQADGSCTVFYLLRGGNFERHILYKNLKEVSSELPETLFCRVHHSFLVNMSYISRYERLGRTGKVHLVNDATVDVSALKLNNFVRHFNRFLKGFEVQ